MGVVGEGGVGGEGGGGGVGMICKINRITRIWRIKADQSRSVGSLELSGSEELVGSVGS